MSISDLIKLAQSKIASLNSAMSTAVAIGDVAQIERIGAELAETAATLAALQSL